MCGRVKIVRVVLQSICALAFLGAPCVAGPAAPRTRAQIEADIRRMANDDAVAGQRNVNVALDVFTDEARQVGMERREITSLYSDEYRVQRERHQPGPWDDARRFATLAVIITAAFAFLRKRIDDTVGKGLALLWASIYQRYAGSRALRRLALRRYRRRLIEKLELLRLPFRPGRPLDMRSIYIPLRAKEARGEDARRRREDVFNALAKQRRLVVLGSPGAGKSMLLKHIALTSAERRLPAPLGQTIPILLELHRLANPNATIEAEMIAELGRTGFPHARSFVEQNLEKCSFLLLLDGLDEMTAPQRLQTARQIADLVARYEDLRVVVSCRTAVYKGELDGIADQKLELIDFNDHEIRRYLRTWTTSMPPGKSVEELINRLEKRPQIKKLAGNPLLLTIIAYLYADHPDVVLPHSRSQFYKTATDQLLERWHLEHNKFTLATKRAILEHLALVHQTRTASNHPDPRAMDFRMVMKEVQGLCPSLNLRSDDAASVLQEIVERSGLLFTIDGGQQYCFAHTTLQEYFTAAKLQQEPERVLQHYEVDRDRWREVLRLWCGLASDSTDVIRKLRAVDPVMSFECLADAQVVSPDLAEGIVTELKTMLCKVGTDGDRTQVAFGAVAADPRARGLDMFQFLVDNLADPRLQPMAARALAETGLVRAADQLGELVEEATPAIRSALVSMSDLAVPVLTRALEEGQLWALQDVHAIRTPRAAEALVPLLWHRANDVALAVAFALGELLKERYIEAALRFVAIPPQFCAPGRFDLTWKPFAESERSSLLLIADRISSLVDEANDDELPRGTLDARIVVPVYIKQLASEPGSAKRAASWTITGIASSRLRALMAAMDRVVALRFVECLKLARRAPTRDDWVSMFHPTEYDIVDGWHLRAYIVICLSLYVPALLQAVLLFWYSAGSTLEVLYYGLLVLLLTGITAVGLLRVVLRGRDVGDGLPIFGFVAMFFYAPVGALRGIWLTVRPVETENRRKVVLEALGMLAAGSWVPFVYYYCHEFLVSRLVDVAVFGWFIAAAALSIALFVLAQRKSRTVMNPLFGLFDRKVSSVYMHWVVGSKYRVLTGFSPSRYMPKHEYTFTDDEEPAGNADTSPVQQGPGSSAVTGTASPAAPAGAR